jgi:cell division septal protein FtsQ
MTRMLSVDQKRTGRRVRWFRVAILVVVVLLVAGVLWVLLSDQFYVFDAEVQGTVRLSPNAVFWASDLPGLHVLWVNAGKIEEQILATLPSIESAEVSCGLPAECTIIVKERQSMTMWDDDGQLWWVDGHGTVFPASRAQSEGWTVRGPLPREGEEQLAEPVRIALSELWSSGIEVDRQLYYVPERGLVITDERGWRVVIGQGPGMDERLRALDAIAAHLEARGVRPRVVDVRFPNAPYYSLTSDW